MTHLARMYLHMCHYLGPYFRYFADLKRLCEDLFNIPILFVKKTEKRLRLVSGAAAPPAAVPPRHFSKQFISIKSDNFEFSDSAVCHLKANQENFKIHVRTTLKCSLSNCRAQNTAKTRLHRKV